MNRKEIEDYIFKHGYSYRWYKDYLFIKSFGVGYKIPLFEFKYAIVPISVIFKSYLSKPGNAVTWIKDEYVYSLAIGG